MLLSGHEMTWKEMYDDVSQAQQYEMSASSSLGAAAVLNYQKAANSYERAAELADEVLGRYDEQSLMIRDYWAAALREANDIKTAIRCNLATLERYKSS